MIKDVLAISIADVEIEWLFNLAWDVITYWRDQLNGVIIKIIMMVKFNLLQHQKLNYLTTERKNIAEDLFSDEADTDMKYLFYVFILNCNPSNIADNSSADTLN